MATKAQAVSTVSEPTRFAMTFTVCWTLWRAKSRRQHVAWLCVHSSSGALRNSLGLGPGVSDSGHLAARRGRSCRIFTVLTRAVSYKWVQHQLISPSSHVVGYKTSQSSGECLFCPDVFLYEYVQVNIAGRRQWSDWVWQWRQSTRQSTKNRP